MNGVLVVKIVCGVACIVGMIWIYASLLNENRRLRHNNHMLSEGLDHIQEVMDDNTIYVNMDFLEKELAEYQAEIEARRNALTTDGDVAERIFINERLITILDIRYRLMKMIKERRGSMSE